MNDQILGYLIVAIGVLAVAAVIAGAARGGSRGRSIRRPASTSRPAAGSPCCGPSRQG